MTNVVGVFLVVRHFLPHLMASERGRIALLSSGMASSRRPLGGAYAYRASKAAVTNLGFNLAADLRDVGVAVGIYSPGWVRTEMGGEGADVPVSASVRGLLRRIDRLTMDSTGVFEDYQGRPLEP
jgi:NAD(P)-dependent dehydrogenase (short-subunit alcohol dehydrogenase family)